MIVIVGFITMAGFWMPLVPAAEVQHVQMGSTVTLGCNFSYLYDTTWFKHNPDHTPTVVLYARLRDGRPVQGFQLSPRFSVRSVNRSLALSITDVEETDLGLYYCIANVNSQLKVGKGTVLQVLVQGPWSWFLQHWYCVFVSLGLLTMMLAICISNWKAQSKKQTNHETPTASRGRQRQKHLRQ